MSGAPDLFGGEAEDAEGRPFADINVTPLVDVMLVLLVVFVMAAPLMVQGVPLDLPRGAGLPIGRPAKPIIVSLVRDGGVFLRDEKIPSEALVDRLKTLRASEGDVPIYVRADRALAYGQVMDVIGRFGAGGFAHVSLLDRPGSAADAVK